MLSIRIPQTDAHKTLMGYCEEYEINDWGFEYILNNGYILFQTRDMKIEAHLEQTVMDPEFYQAITDLAKELGWL